VDQEESFPRLGDMSMYTAFKGHDPETCGGIVRKRVETTTVQLGKYIGVGRSIVIRCNTVVRHDIYSALSH